MVTGVRPLEMIFRLMSYTMRIRETANDLFDLNINRLGKLSLNAMKGAFAHYDKRIEIIFEAIESAFTIARATLGQAAGLTDRV